MRNILLSLSAALALSLPAVAKSAAKSEVHCTDGSTSKGGRGACSGHGGIARTTNESVKVAPAPAAKTAAPSAQERAPAAAAEPQAPARADAPKNGGVLGGLFGRRAPSDTPRSSTREAPAAKSGTPMATCKDGTTSYSAHRSGTCSGHGGVKTWLDDK